MVVFEKEDGKHVDWYIRDGLGKVIILALTPEGKVIVTKQFRSGIHSIDTALVAGGIKPGYTPLQNAKMELEEDEFIDVFIMDMKKVTQRVSTGKMKDIGDVLATGLALYYLYRDNEYGTRNAI